MSYILDALKKAKHERELGQIPNLQTIHATPTLEFSQTKPDKNKKIIKFMVGFILIINISVLTLLFINYIYKPVPELQQYSAKMQPSMRIPDKVLSENQTTITKPVAAITPPTSPLIKHTEFSLPEPFIKPDPNKPDPKKTKLEKPQNPLPDKLIPKQEKKELPTTLPLLQTMPVAFQQKIPHLDINVHVYASQSEKRFVLINGKRYQEGMQINKTITLEKIRTNDIILRYKKQYFRLQRP